MFSRQDPSEKNKQEKNQKNIRVREVERGRANGDVVLFDNAFPGFVFV